MRVKRLEIQVFKSFKDKTVVHFDHNITGIVGPNGCGKSNIVDAFFWVMASSPTSTCGEPAARISSSTEAPSTRLSEWPRPPSF